MICQIQIKLLLKSSSFNGQRLSSEQSAFGSITPWRHILGTFLKRLRVCWQVMRCLVFPSVCQLADLAKLSGMLFSMIASVLLWFGMAQQFSEVLHDHQRGISFRLCLSYYSGHQWWHGDSKGAHHGSSRLRLLLFVLDLLLLLLSSS